MVTSGFLDIYPAHTVPAHPQNLVSGYATYQDLPPRSCYKSCSLIRDGAHQPKEE